MTDKIGANKEPAQFDEVAMGGKEDKKKSLENTDEGCFLTVPDDYGNTPIHLAAAQGHFEMIVALLDLGALVDIKNQNGETALHLAAKEGHEDVVEQLLKAGADPGLKTTGGRTVWHIAAAAGHAGILKLLHTHDVHKINDCASRRDNQISVVKEKVQNESDIKLTNEDCLEKGKELPSTSPDGEDMDVRNENIRNYLSEASKKKLTGKNVSGSYPSRSLAPVLLSENISYDAPLTESSSSSDSEYLSDSFDEHQPNFVFRTVSFLLRQDRNRKLPPRCVLEVQANIVNSICRMKDVDAQAVDENEWTLLHRAAFSGAEYSVQRLIKKGANVDAVTSRGFTPLFLAAMAGWPRIINILLKARASTVNVDGLSALHVAVMFRQLESVRELLPKVRPNIKGPLGRTPLHLAAFEEENSIAIGEALINAGAEISPRDISGLTPLDLARLVSNTAFCIFLIYHHKATS